MEEDEDEAKIYRNGVMLSQDQVVFVLRVVGKEWLYTGGETRPGETPIDSIRHDIDNPVGILASRLAFQYQLSYLRVPPRGKIVLGAPPSVDELRSELQTIGLRVPNAYRTSPEEVLRYFEEFGSLYLPFNSPTTSPVKTEWLPGAPPLFVNRPLMTGADVWVNPYLATHLRDLYTDFDLFDNFANILPEPETFKNRKEIIDAIVKYHRPAGDFWVELGFTSVRLIHQYNSQTRTYNGPDAIRSIAEDGRLYLDGIRLAHVGLYQIAFLFKPEYLAQTYGVEVSDLLLGSIQAIYRHFVNQIKTAERRGEQRIRFSDQLAEFNQDLN